MIELVPNQSWLSGVQYDQVTRRHRLDRRRVPSVTQAIDLAHPHRFDYVAPDVLARKAAIGTAVHRAAHYHAEHDLVDTSIAAAVVKPFEAWKWFTETRRVEPILCETVVCSRDLGVAVAARQPYVGKLDFLVMVDRRLHVLLDLKTGVPMLARLQTLAYLDALYQQYPQLIGIDVERWAVVLGADGVYRVHAFRDDALDAHDFRLILRNAYAATAADWSPEMVDSQRTSERPLELPDEDPLDGDPLFDLPDDGAPLGPPAFEIPAEPPPPVSTGDVLPPETPSTIRELIITPDVDAYLTQLEAAIAPFEATAQAFAAEMATAPIDTPERLADLGRKSLMAKEREKQIENLFEPAIRKPRMYLDRVYAVRRRVSDWWKTGGATAARRYTARQRELEEADRLARLDADRRTRAQQQENERQAAATRRQLAQQATQAAAQGDQAAVANLIDLARAVEVAPVEVEQPPPSLAAAAKVPGMGVRVSWRGSIVDITTAVLAAGRPHLLRELADAIAGGAMTLGGQTITTEMIATNIRALANDLPAIPMSVFGPNEDELQKRADADKDTLAWPGFLFEKTDTPVRRPGARQIPAGQA